MLISALCDYCDILEQRKKLPPEGYARIGISYLISLNEDGSMSGIIDVRKKQEEIVKNKVKTSYLPRDILLPERPRSSSISANFVEIRGSYIFGLEYRSGREDKAEELSAESKGRTEKQKKKLFYQHQSFADEVQKDFEDIISPSDIVRAYIHFSKKWQPENETGNPLLLGLGPDLNTAKFAFCLSGHPEIMLQDDSGVGDKWNQINDISENTDVCQCAVTGRSLPAALTHDTLVTGKGVGIRNAGINPSLVNFKWESFGSYGHKQGVNACLSVTAMKKYTKALNWLLTSPLHHSYLDGLTLVYWTAGAEETEYDPMRMLLGGNTDQADTDEMDNELSAAAEDARNADISRERIDFMSRVSSDTDYYIIALAPNSSRIQVKFIYRQKLGRVFENIAKYQKDVQIIGQRMGTIPLWKLKKELVSPKSDKPEQLDAMFLSVLRSIVTGTDYPTWMLAETVNRVKKDCGEANRLTYVRAGMIKACISRHSKEVMTMGLDKDNASPAYLCGRLFAVLQKIQEDSAAPQKLNRTIEDAYFSAASSNPAAVMPKLMRLSQHHMAKLKKNHPDWAVNDSRQLDDILSRLGTSFPRTLGLYDQGRFILGYYQQNAERFTSKKKGVNENAGA